MERLSLEVLARLVDEEPSAEEKKILAGNPALREELEALREQTRALRDLPAVLPPPEGWSDLETRLAEEGLIHLSQTVRRTNRWLLQAAAGLVFFLGGAGVATAISGNADGSGPVAVGPFDSVEEAVQAVETAERQYLQAVGAYQQTVRRNGNPPAASGDPASRFAALEALLAASQAAVRESPADPFFNGVLVNTLMERQQTLRQISGDNWY